MNELDAKKLRTAFGSFMTGVTVATTTDGNDIPVGFTANSFTSVSLLPPLLLVCPARTLSSFEVFNSCPRFAINILADDQRDIANLFASPGGDRFERAAWRKDKSGCPLIDDAAAFFSCAVESRVDAGDHIILIGRVDDFGFSGRPGLGYFNGGYFSLSLERRAAGRRLLRAGVIMEYDGKVLLEETSRGLRLPQAAAEEGSALSAIRDLFQTTGVVAEFGAVYSIFDNRETGESIAYYRASAKDEDARGLGAYLAADDFLSRRFESPAVESMMRRYVLERQNGVFGLYVGDEQTGDVHIMENRA